MLLVIEYKPYTYNSKLAEHLKSYYEIWKSHLNAKHTAMATTDQRKAIDKLIHHPARLIQVPSVSELQPSSQPTAGKLPELPTVATLAPRILPIASTSKRRQPPTDTQGPSPQDDQNGNGEEGPRKRHKRKCWRCGLYDCRGKGRGGKCNNPCQDCGDIGEGEDRCPGRDSRKRGKLCPRVSESA